jgi:hypothetical protein
VSFISFVSARVKFAVGDEERRVVSSHVDEHGVVVNLRPLAVEADAEPVITQEIEQCERGNLHQFDFDLAIEERAKMVRDLFLFHREQADFGVKEEAPLLLIAAAERLEVPVYVFERERNLLAGFVLDDLRDPAGFHGGQLNELRERRLPRQADRDQIGTDFVPREKRVERLPDEFIGRRIGLAQKFRMRDVIEGRGDHLPGRFRVPQSHRLETSLPDLNAPDRLIVRHDVSLPSRWVYRRPAIAGLVRLSSGMVTRSGPACGQSRQPDNGVRDVSKLMFPRRATRETERKGSV